MVIVFHWSPNSHHFLLPLGSWGVELFFVLSGFLITKILLEDRIAAELNFQNKIGVIKNFLLRRCLRIFPIYYLSLIAIVFFDRTNVSGLRDHWLYFVAYASNIFYFKTQHFNYPMAHFWSLAVEEQFYLIWPWFVLFLPWKYLKSFFWISIIVGIGSRIVLAQLFTTTEVTVDVLTPTCFDGFSIGGLFAWYTVKQGQDMDRIIARINIAGSAAFIIMMVFLVANYNQLAVLHRSLSSIFFLALIANAYKGFKGIAGIVADNKVLLYLGKISYGLYIYHLITPWLTVIFLNIISKSKSVVGSFVANGYYNMNFFPKFVTDLGILLLVSSFSWYWIEKPINRYKHFFR